MRRFCMGVLIVLTVFAQCSLFQYFAVASIRPNLLLILTVSFALMRGQKSGMLTGFFSGLCMDIFFPGTIGFQALIYMWIGYICGCFYRYFYDDDIKTPLLLVSAADLAYGFYQYVFTFLLRGRIHFLFYLRRIMIPEMLYTIVMTLLTYGLLYRLNRLLSKTDRRRIDSIV